MPPRSGVMGRNRRIQSERSRASRRDSGKELVQTYNKTMIKISQATINRYEKRVNAGVRWLNRNRKGWLGAIKSEILNLESVKSCVLGQLFENFWVRVSDPDEGNETGKLPFEKSVSLGFAEPKEAARQNYDLLTFTWQQKIKQLKAKA